MVCTVKTKAQQVHKPNNEFKYLDHNPLKVWIYTTGDITHKMYKNITYAVQA